MLISLNFQLRRHLQLLRRALGSMRTNGWRATWLRARSGLATPARTAPAGFLPEEQPVPWDGSPWVLVVDDAMPQPDRDSGSLRLANLMRVLVSARYRIAFVPDDGRVDPAGAARLRADGIHVPALDGSVEAASWVRRHCRAMTAAVLCRHHVAGHWLPLMRSVAPQATVVFDTVDLHYLRERREAELHGDLRLQRRADSTRQRELALVARADVTWVVSSIERELLRQERPDADVRVLSNIIDEDTPGLPFDQRRDLLFVGGLRHPPNRDAVEWLGREIFPRIRKALPDTQLHLVGAPGAGASPAFAADSGIRLHGHVADIQPFLDGCRVALAPLRFGAGVKGKVNLSLAHGQPVVATACATEGMYLTSGVDVLVASEADAFASEVVRLYRDADLWRRLSDNGRANVREHFSPTAALRVAVATLGPTHASAPLHGSR